MKVTLGNYPKSGKTKRKVKVQIDDWDDYSADHTIALIAVPLLKKLKTRKRGIPVHCFEDPNNSGEEAEKKAQEKWDQILDSMIWSLEQVIEETDRPEWDLKASNEDKDRMAVIHRAYHERIQKGLELFGKHFLSLWW